MFQVFRMNSTSAIKDTHTYKVQVDDRQFLHTHWVGRDPACV